MKIWKLEYDVNNYEAFIPEAGLFAIDDFDGTSQKEGWQPMKMVPADPKEHLPFGDAAYLTTPMYSRRALEVLLPLMGDSVEILPMLCDEGDYSAVNVIDVIDAIDYEKSKFERFKCSGRIMCFDKYAFVPEKVAGKHIFKIVDHPKSNSFVSDEFMQVVEKNGLTGFKSELVWDSEA